MPELNDTHFLHEMSQNNGLGELILKSMFHNQSFNRFPFGNRDRTAARRAGGSCPVRFQLEISSADVFRLEAVTPFAKAHNASFRLWSWFNRRFVELIIHGSIRGLRLQIGRRQIHRRFHIRANRLQLVRLHLTKDAEGNNSASRLKRLQRRCSFSISSSRTFHHSRELWRRL